MESRAPLTNRVAWAALVAGVLAWVDYAVAMCLGKLGGLALVGMAMVPVAWMLDGAALLGGLASAWIARSRGVGMAPALVAIGLGGLHGVVEVALFGAAMGKALFLSGR